MGAVEPDRSILTSIDHYADTNATKALQFVKEIFVKTDVPIPPLVQLALKARCFQYFYTTNLDEILFAAARDNEIAAYPSYIPLTAKFVHLHGRAATAQSFHDDLVLGARGYDLAYNESMGAPAKNKLSQLVPYPVVFMGFSMTDRPFVWSLENIARVANRRNVTTIDQGPLETLSKPNWYVLLRAPDSRDPGREERKLRRESTLAQAGIQIIWYQDGDTPDRHAAALEIVRRMGQESRELTVTDVEPGFAERLLDAETLASVTFPVPYEVQRATGMLKGHPRIAATFLERVDGLQWFHQLRDAGALDPKESVVTANGTQSAPYWIAVDFLRRTAAIAPSEIKEFLLTIETDNWVAIRQAFSILEALDESSAVTLGERFATWAVTAMSSDPLLLFRVARTAGQLEADGKHEAAFALVQATLIELARSGPSLSAGSAPRFSKAVVPILARSPVGLDAATRILRTALEKQYGTARQDMARYSRRTIEIHRMSLPDASMLDLAIDILRETLLATEDSSSRAHTVTTLLGSPWPTERRVGIAHCFLCRLDLSEHEAVIITPENLANPHLFHELAKLITNNVEDLSQGAILVLKEFMTGLHEKAGDAEGHDYVLWARVMPAEWLPVSRPADADDAADADEHLFRDVYVSDVFTPSAPLDKASFAERAKLMTYGDLLALVRNPAAQGVRVTWRHDTDEMWTLLAEYAKEQELLEPLLEISSEDIDGGSWHAIEAMAEVAGDSTERWKQVLAWADHMVSVVPSDKLWSLGRLVEKSSSAAPRALSPRIRALAMRMIEKTKRSSAVESDLTEESLRGGFFNHPAGKATRTVFELLLREMAEQEATAGTRGEIPQWFKESVLEHMAREPLYLGIDAWIGLGRYYSLLYDRSPEALVFVVQHLETDSSDFSTSTIAFWSGHLWAPSVSSDALQQLMSVYRTHALTLQREGVIEADLRDVFFQHIVIGVLRALPGFDDILQDTLGEAFTPVARGSIASALGHGIAEASEDPGTPFHSLATEQFRQYWTEHANRFGDKDGEQLTNYLNWLREVSIQPTDIAFLVEASLVQVTNGSGAYQVFEYLDRYVEEDPAGVLRLLAACVEWYRRDGDFWPDSKEVRTILDRLAPQVPKEAMFREVIDGLAELGTLSTDDVRRYLASGPMELE